MYSPQNYPISSNGRKLLYIAQNAIAFSLSQILNSALYFAELNNIIGASALLDIFVVNPLTISVVCSHSLIYSHTHLLAHSFTHSTQGSFIIVLWTCPCLENVYVQREYPVFHHWLQVLGKLVVLPFLLLIFCTLVIAATFSQGGDFVLILVTFFIQVQVLGALQELVAACLLFKDHYYCSVRIVFPFFKTFKVLTIGRLFCERIISENMQEKGGYSAKEYRYLFGFIQIDTVVTTCASNVTIHDVEMVSNNPMHGDTSR